MAALSLGLRRRAPLVLQTEAAECGLACLAMVLGYHGVVTDLATLRARHGMSLRGTTANVLSRVAQEEGLGCRGVRMDLAELRALRLPSVLHWDLNHFVVLVAFDGNVAVIHDPAGGRRRIALAEVSRHFTGVALELWPDPGFQPRQEKAGISLAQLLGQVSGFWSALGQVLTLSLVLQLLALLGPLLLQWIVDDVVVARDTGLLATLCIGYLLLLVLQQAVGLVRSWLLLVIGAWVKVQWRANIFRHLLRLPLAWFQKRHLGDVVSRTGAIDDLQRVLTSAFVEGLLDGLMMLLTLVMMFVYSVQLASLALVAVVLYLGLRLAWYTPLYLATEDQIVRAATLSTHFLETVRGIRTIRLFGRERERREAWQSLLVAETNAGLSVQKARIFYGVARSSLSGVFHILLLWAGTLQVLAGNLSVGMLMAFIAYRSVFDARVSSLIDQAIDLRMLRLYGERLGDVVLEPAERAAATPMLARDAQHPPAIDLEQLRFRYSAHDPWIIDGLSLSIGSGQAVAIVGPSGCGKSTLVNLLVGVLGPQEGGFRVDGLPVDVVASDSWRAMVGAVMQDDALFAGSIADNISFFETRPDPEAIAACARLAAVDQDIEAMPMGYETLVGDMGTVLSGGQKQRVMLARALYKRPRVLVLDEATSDLDVRREAEVNAALRRLAITRIVVTHRPETLLSADRVIEMGQGRVVYDGPPQGYLARQGLGLVPRPAA
jgi:ATP-binding cassette subfamily B protein RaxB